MACRTENSKRLFRSAGMDLRYVTRRAIDPNRRQTAEMFHFGFSAETDRPAECGIWNQSEISEVGGRNDSGINFNDGAQHAVGHEFGAHRAVEENVEMVGGPLRNSSG